VKTEPPDVSGLAHIRSLLSDFSMKPVAVSPDVDHHAVVQQAIQKGRHDDSRIKMVLPSSIFMFNIPLNIQRFRLQIQCGASA